MATCRTWCARSESSIHRNCHRCSCQLCAECATRQRVQRAQRAQRVQRVQTPAHTTASCSRVLLVLIRGIAFRSGRRGSNFSTASAAPQIKAFESIRDRVLLPAWKAGWAPEILASVSVRNSSSAAKIRTLLRNTLCVTALRFETGRTQMENLHAALHWSWFAARARFGRFGAMLILRADVEFKMDVKLPSPDSSKRHKIVVPFEALVVHPTSKHAANRQRTMPKFALPEIPDVCDVVIYLPRCRLEEFVLAAAPFRTAPSLLHKMCYWSLGGISYLLPHAFNSDTAVHANPLYQMISRTEGPTKEQWAACQASWGWTPQWCGRPAAERGRECPLRPDVRAVPDLREISSKDGANRSAVGNIHAGWKTTERLGVCMNTSAAAVAAPYMPYIPAGLSKETWYVRPHHATLPQSCSLPAPEPLEWRTITKTATSTPMLQLHCTAPTTVSTDPVAQWSISSTNEILSYSRAEQSELWDRDIRRVGLKRNPRHHVAAHNSTSSHMDISAFNDMRYQLMTTRGDGHSLCKSPCGVRIRAVDGKRLPFQSDAHE